MDLPTLSELRFEDISLTTPIWLWLLLVIPFFLIIQRFSLVDLSRLQQFFSFVMRALVVVCLTLAMAGLATRSFSQNMAVVIAVDVSPSIPDRALKKMQEYVDNLWKKRKKNDSIKIVTFASSTRLLKSKENKPPKIKRHPKEQASNLQGALRHAYGLFPEGKLKRLVLVSDGRETRGSAVEEALRAKERKIKVYSVAVQGPYPPEVLIQNVRIPEIIRLRAPFSLYVEVFSTYPAKKVPITIYKNGFVFAYRRIDLVPGLQKIRFKTRIDEPGLTSFQAIIKPKLDRFRGNNYFVRAVPIQGEPRILYLEGEPNKAYHLARALRKQRFRVEVRSDHGVPTSLRDLERYDLVILSDIPAFKISASQMRLLEMYVQDLGGGLVMVGGENSFGPGGYFQTRLEKVLPVRFDIEKKKEAPSLAMVLVIDKSGSMSGERIRLAREAAKTTVKMLGPNDKIGVVAFDYRAREVVSLQALSGRKSQVLYDLSRIPASGGTNIAAALEKAYAMLSQVQAKIKHVILLSDGQDSNRRIPTISQQMHAENMTISTIAVGSGSDRSTLRNIAELGGGRYYYTEDPYSIPKLFTKETSKVNRSSFVEEPFRPRVLSRSQAIKGINFARAPFLLGYVSTKSKPRSRVILGTEHGEPLLVSWRYGLGKVVAYTSDVKSRWAFQWLSWSGFGRFWAQVLRDTMRQGSSQELRVKATIKEGIGKITVDALDHKGDFLDYMDAKVLILDPRLKKTRMKLRQTGPGFYSGTFAATRHGAYLVKVRFFKKKRLVGTGQASASYSYPAEWLSAMPDRQRLESIAKAGGGATEPKAKAVWHRNADEKLLSHKPLWPYLVILALILFLLDIFFRRIRIFGRAAHLE